MAATEDTLKEEEAKFSTDIPKKLKKRLGLFCVSNDILIKTATADALENYLDIMEGKG